MNSFKNHSFCYPNWEANIIVILIIIVTISFTGSTQILKQTSASENQITFQVSENVFQEMEKQQEKIMEDNIIFSRGELSPDQEEYNRQKSLLEPLPKPSEITNQDNQKLESLFIPSETEIINQYNRKLELSYIQYECDELNRLLELLSAKAQAGTLKTKEIGITPIFKFTTADIDKVAREQTFKNLRKGSYCTKQETIMFNIDEKDSWKDLGNWKISGYNATVAQCDSTPSITASLHLVTPGFTMAIDKKYWKWGTIFFIEDVGFAIAADCGGSGIRGKSRGDYLTASKKYAYEIGGQHKVYLIYEPDK